MSKVDPGRTVQQTCQCAWPDAIRVALGSILLGACMASEAAEWQTDHAASFVAMYASQQGTMIRGLFGEFTAEIEFDEANPETGRILGVVETASVETGDSQNDTYVLGYLEVDEYPEARFEATAIERTADGYRATGRLSLVGQNKPATMEFTFVSATGSSEPGRVATFTGTMTINRFDIDIASEIDANQAGQDVIVYVELNLRR